MSGVGAAFKGIGEGAGSFASAINPLNYMSKTITVIVISIVVLIVIILLYSWATKKDTFKTTRELFTSAKQWVGGNTTNALPREQLVTRRDSNRMIYSE